MTPKKNLTDIKKVAEEHGWKINEKTYKAILNGLNKNMEKFGVFYCPCKLKHHETNICPCADSQKEIDQTGHCHCNLYLKQE